MAATDPDVESWPPCWLAAVRRRLRRWCARGAGTSWVVAVSGGSDSVGLLRVLHHLAPGLGLTLSVAHLDHGVRGAAAREDAAFVEALARTLGLPFDLGQWRPERAAHFEADARKARYEWLRQVAAARGATSVAVGHTRDDQAETILHRIVRGTGPRGLAGIPWRRRLDANSPLLLVRPLLAVSRQEVRQALRTMGQEFHEDASNADRSRTRARIRHDLIPRLAAQDNPRVVEAIARLGTLAAASRRLMDHWLDDLESEVTASFSGDRIKIRREPFARLPAVLRVELIRRLWRRAGWPEAEMSARRWQRLARWALARPSGTRDVGVGFVLKADTQFDSLVLERSTGGEAGDRPGPREVTLDIPGAIPWGPGRVAATVDPDDPRDETIDLDRIVPPLLVRAAVPGDRFAPLGMNGRSTPLNDFFRGRKVGPAERAQTPLVCDAAGIVWVAGHRIADRVRLSDGTSRRLGLRWEPRQADPSGP